MSKFNKKKITPVKKTRNIAGGVAFTMSPAQELTHAVLTTFLEDKAYESGSDRATRIVKLVEKNNHEFVANLAVVARKEFNLRSVATLLLGELSQIHKGDSIVKDAIVAGSLRVDDLSELISYVGTPVPKQVKRGIRNAILKFNRYQLAKYKGDGKEVSLVDVFNLVHPKVQHANKEQKKAWKDLMEGNLASFDTWETEISNAKDDKARTKAWETLIKEDKLGYMALLRNLNNLTKYGVSEKVKKLAIKKLTDPEEVKKSKQLPFRFVTAYDNVKGDRELSDAISEAMDIAVDNVPEFSGRTLIAVDSSGSMSGDPIQKASIFAATLLKANKKADVILYDTRIRELTLSGRAPVIDTAHKIEKTLMGGGTETPLAFDYAYDQYRQHKEYDRIIIISDNQSWVEYGSRSVQDAYTAYKSMTKTDPYVYAIDIQGYGTTDVKGGKNKVFHLTGWSNRLLDFVAQAEKGESLVDYIKNYKFKKDEKDN